VGCYICIRDCACAAAAFAIVLRLLPRLQPRA
jgi:hypothetical protein